MLLGLLFAFAVASLLGLGGEANPALSIGAPLPVLEGKSLSGMTVLLPTSAADRPALLVVGFTKASARATEPWLTRCRQLPTASTSDEPSKANCYDIRMLESVPRLFRGFVERGMRNGYPRALWDSTILVYSQNELWKGRVGYRERDGAYVIALDRDGRVRAIRPGAFNQDAFEQLVGVFGLREQDE